MSLSKAKKLMISSEKEYLKNRQAYKDMLWEHALQEGGVTIIKSFEYARPLVTFNGKWDEERYIKVKSPIETRFVEIDGVVYYPDFYSDSRGTYSYELRTKEDYICREMQKEKVK